MPVGPNYNLISPLSSNVTNAIVTVTQTLNVASTATVQSLIVTGAASVTGLTSSGDATVIGNLGVASTATIERLVLTGTATGSLTDGLWLGPQGATDIRLYKQAANTLGVGMGNQGVNGFINGPIVLAGQFGVGGTANGTQFFLNGVTNTGMFLQASGGQLTANNVISFSWGTTGACTVLGNLNVASTLTVGGAVKGFAATQTKTANYNVLPTDSFTTFDNNGTSATVVIFTLPSTGAAVGAEYTFCDVSTLALSGIQITPQTGDTICYSSKTAGQSINSPVAARGSVTLINTSTNNWAVVSMVGTFT